MPNHTTIVRS